MQRFVQRLTNLFPKTITKPLGRWSYEKCHTRLDQKIDLSNEDHCGPCGQYALTKTAFDSNAGSTDEPERTADPHTTQLDSDTLTNGARPSLVKFRSMQTRVEWETRHGASSLRSRNMFFQGLVRQSFLVPHSTVKTHTSKHAMAR
jgi:hypothetical protein